MTADELHAQRMQNFIDAANFKEPDKIPAGIDITGWAFRFSNATYRDLMHDLRECTNPDSWAGNKSFQPNSR